MKRFLSKNGIWLLAGVAVVVVVLCIISAVSSGTPFLRNAAGVIASPFRAAGPAVAGWFGGIGDHFDKVADLQQENDDLRAQVADLERQLRQAQKESEENQRIVTCWSCKASGATLKTVSALRHGALRQQLGQHPDPDAGHLRRSGYWRLRH